MNSLISKLKVVPQYFIPQHFLSSVMYKITRCSNPLVKNTLIRTVVKLYGINLHEALHSDLSQYRTFNHFFTRALKPELRPIDSSYASIISPVDGTVSQGGKIKQGQIFQAKSHYYSVEALLANDDRCKNFSSGEFVTIYLSPKDYHRIHAPFTGKLRKMTYIPGRLFSVNHATTCEVNGLFAKNERVVCHFDTDFGPAVVILVGAIFVSSMDTVWAGEITPSNLDRVTQWDYSDRDYVLNKGDELGRFNMGSTVILLFPESSIAWAQNIEPYQTLTMGEKIAESQI